MLEIEHPRAVLEISSWLPEIQRGGKGLSLHGRELPREVGASLPGSLRALCLAPGKWLLVSDEQPAASIIERFAAELGAQGGVVVDTTDGIATLSIRGAFARDVLSKGCGLDFDSSVFPIGRCARTRFAQMAVLIELLDEAPSFRLYVARSYVRFLVDWLADAAVEFQCSPQ